MDINSTSLPPIVPLNDETRAVLDYASSPEGRTKIERGRQEIRVEHPKRVSPTCLIHFDRNRYSVPASFANQPVSVRVYPERIVVAAEGQIVCEHARVFARSHERQSTTTVFDWRHYLAVIQRKPGALRNGAPFAELPPAFRTLQQRMLKTPGGDREMVEILALFSSMTNKPCSRLSRWRWRLARRPRRTS